MLQSKNEIILFKKITTIQTKFKEKKLKNSLTESSNLNLRELVPKFQNYFSLDRIPCIMPGACSPYA